MTRRLTLALVMLLAACGDGGGVAAGDPLTGRTFLSTAVEGRTLVEGTRVRLEFHDDGRLTASAGCNTMGGAARISEDRLTVDELSMTEMGCDPPRHDQDRWLADLLTAGPAYELDGDRLRLTSGDTVLELLDRRVVDPDRPLEGTVWTLDGIVEGDAVSSVPAGAETTLRFSGGRVDVRSCNQGGAEVRVAGDRLEIEPLAMTKMACEEERMAVESAVTAVLDGTIRYEIEAASLTLTHPGGRGLVLVAR